MGLAALAVLGLVVAVLLRPVIGGLILVGAVPILSGMAPGIPVAHLRISEILIGVVGATVLISARRSDAVPWSSLDWLLLAYGAGWAIFGWLDAIALNQHLSITCLLYTSPRSGSRASRGRARRGQMRPVDRDRCRRGRRGGHDPRQHAPMTPPRRSAN